MKAKVLVIALAAIMHDGIMYAPDSDNTEFECSEKEAAVLVDAGVAKIAEGAGAGTNTKDPLMDLKVDELKALAEQREVVIPEGITKKIDIVAFLNSDEGQGKA